MRPHRKLSNEIIAIAAAEGLSYEKAFMKFISSKEGKALARGTESAQRLDAAQTAPAPDPRVAAIASRLVIAGMQPELAIEIACAGLKLTERKLTDDERDAYDRACAATEPAMSRVAKQVAKPAKMIALVKQSRRHTGRTDFRMDPDGTTFQVDYFSDGTTVRTRVE